MGEHDKAAKAEHKTSDRNMAAPEGTGKRLAAFTFVTNPETGEDVTVGPGEPTEYGADRKNFTFGSEQVDELPQWARDQITNPKAWVR